MSASPYVSVNLPVRNGEAFIRASLDGVAAQTYRDWECVVLDDGSTDGTRVIVEEYVRRDPRFRLVTITEQEHRPYPAVRNRGMRESRGTWIAQCDADDVWYPEKLAAQVAEIERRPGAVLSYHRGVYVRRGARLHEGPWPKQIDRFLRNVAYEPHFPHASVMILRDALLAVDGYDELTNSCDDQDLWIRLAARYGDRAVVCVDRTLMTVNYHDGNMSGNAPKQIAAERALVRKFAFGKGWIVLHPLLSKAILDGHLDRTFNRMLTLQRPGAAAWHATCFAATAPWRRWRWQRWFKAMRNWVSGR